MGKFKYIDAQLAGRDYLMGKQFTVADGYLYTMLRWADGHKLDLSGLKNLMAFKARVDGPPEGAGSADQGRPDEGGVSKPSPATTHRQGAGSAIRPFSLFHGPLYPEPVAKAPMLQPTRVILRICKLNSEHQAVSRLSGIPLFITF